VIKHLSSNHPDTPIIVVSGTGLIEDAISAMRNGAWDYLSKPIEDLSVLRDLMQGTLERAEAAKKNRRYQKRLEEEVSKRTAELARAYSALLKSEEKFVKIFQFSPDPIIISSYTTGKVLNVNKAFSDITGYAKDEVIGVALKDVGIWETNSEEFEYIRQAIIENGECLNFETTACTREDRVVDVVFSARCVKFSDETNVITIIRDVSEQKELEKQLIQSQKMESIGRLAGGIAHDFNNLLIPVLGYAEMMLMDIDQDHEYYDFVKDIHGAADKARMLIRQLLAFSRKQLLEIKPISLAEVIEEFERILRRTIREDISLDFDLPRDLNNIKGDAAQIEQILMNLCVNSQDAMPDGGSLKIVAQNKDVDQQFSSQHPEINTGSYVTLSVADTGCGMSEEIRLNIFDPFFTTKDVDKGTGLGLATVYGIVKQHKGYIAIDSQPGQGTVFTVYFPTHADKSVYVETGVAGLSEKPPGKGETILVVEDDISVRDLIKNILEKYGYHVIAVDNPSDCIDIVQQSKITVDLLLTDVIMPNMNGTRLYATLSEIIPNLKVIYMSGYEDTEIKQLGTSASDAVFLKKPFTISGLLKTIYQSIKNPTQQ